MARIRTVKPGFFRHELLQDTERDNPGSYVMLVFAGLWGHCDKAGRFEWRPRQLKLDVLPFLDFDMSRTLEILKEVGFIKKYSVDDKIYGEISTLSDHQRFSGKEAQEPEKYPPPPIASKGSTREAIGKHVPAQEEEREMEGEEEMEGRESPSGLSAAHDPEIDDDLKTAFEDWNTLAFELGLPKAQKLDPERKSKIRARMRDAGGLAGWRDALTKIRGSPFLRGEKKDFRATLDFVLGKENFKKIMEGNYDAKSARNTTPEKSPWIAEGDRLTAKYAAQQAEYDRLAAERQAGIDAGDEQGLRLAAPVREDLGGIGNTG